MVGKPSPLVTINTDTWWLIYFECVESHLQYKYVRVSIELNIEIMNTPTLI